LYANNGRLAPTLYPQLGRELGLDEAKFTACLGDASREQTVMRDVVEARGLGITGTPSFVIGKIQGDVLTVVRLAKGAPSFEVFAQEIEKLRMTPDSGATPQTK
jgi:predicted DsbA family dithiol-disulfide isomerase